MSHPSIFYKYTSASTAEIILKSRKLRWSSPYEFNDLSEFQRMPLFEPSIENEWLPYIRVLVDVAFNESTLKMEDFSNGTKILISLILRLKGSGMSKVDVLAGINIPCPFNQDKITDVLREFTESLENDCARVFCLTEDYNNDVMWAHYADNHRGCVFGFKHLVNTPFLAAQPVGYADGLPVVCSGLDFLLYGDTKKLRKKTIDAICFSKEKSWSYEKEWRVVTWRPNEKGVKYGDYLFYEDELESVTFGARAADKFKGDLINLLQVNYPRCKVYQLINKHGVSTREVMSY